MNMFEICKLQQKQFKIEYSLEQERFIANMPVLVGKEWDKGKVRLDYRLWEHGDGVKIDALKAHISEELNEKQEPYCAYCGMRLNLTSNDQIEHIAPKGPNRYPQFMFEKSNLILACSLCNGFEKKEKKENMNTISKLNAVYENCQFNIVHPYFDNPEEHLDLGSPENKRVTIFSRTLKGQKTIAVFNLDDEPQTNERFKHYLYYICDIDSRFGELLDALNEYKI